MIEITNDMCGLLKLPNIGVRQDAAWIVGSCRKKPFEGKLKM